MPPQHDTLMTQYLAAIPPSSFFYVFSSQKWLCEDDCEGRHMVQLTATLPIVREEYVRQLLGRRSLWLWGGPSCKRRFRICFGWPADGRGALHWWLSEMNSAHTALAFYSKALLAVREGFDSGPNILCAERCFKSGVGWQVKYLSMAWNVATGGSGMQSSCKPFNWPKYPIIWSAKTLPKYPIIWSAKTLPKYPI